MKRKQNYVKGVNERAARFTIWMKNIEKKQQKYRKEVHRNTTKQKAKLCKRSRGTTSWLPNKRAGSRTYQTKNNTCPLPQE